MAEIHRLDDQRQRRLRRQEAEASDYDLDIDELFKRFEQRATVEINARREAEQALEAVRAGGIEIDDVFPRVGEPARREKGAHVPSADEISTLFAASRTASEGKRASKRHESRLKQRIMKWGGPLAVGAVVAAVWVASNLEGRGAHKQPDLDVSAEIRQLIPGQTDPYRVLEAGGERRGVFLVNVVSIRDYIFDRMQELSPTGEAPVSRDEVLELIRAENIYYQLEDQGREPEDVDPLNVDQGQPYRLPDSWGVGEHHEPDVNAGNQ